MIAGIVLRTSLELGLVVLLTAPLLVILAMPLLQAAGASPGARADPAVGPDLAGHRHRRRAADPARHRRGADVRGQLRRPVPADPGGGRLDAGRWQAAVDAASVLFSGLFLVTLTVLGAQQVAAGELQIGQLVSFFGYAVFMVWPIQTFFELAQKWVRAIIAARKTVAVMEQQPPWREPGAAAGAAGRRRAGRPRLRLRRPAGPVHDRGLRHARRTRPRWPTDSAATCRVITIRSAWTSRTG